MAEVAAARRPLPPPSSSSSLLPPPHRARPISLLAHATPQPARGRGREPRGSFGPPRRPSLLRCGFLRASASLLRRGFLRAATTSGGGTLSPLPRRRPSLPPPSYSLPELERIWASPSLLAGARADRHARRVRYARRGRHARHARRAPRRPCRPARRAPAPATAAASPAMPAAAAALAARATATPRAEDRGCGTGSVPGSLRPGSRPTAEVVAAAERRGALTGSGAAARGGGATAGGDDSPDSGDGDRGKGEAGVRRAARAGVGLGRAGR